MSATCEVIGWLFDDQTARMVVREENGTTSFENVRPESPIGDVAIQTGTFRRGKAILDPVTSECVGYEMEPLSSRFALV